MLKKIRKSEAKNIRFNSYISKISNDYIVVNGKKIFFEYLVGADGSNSLVRKYLGLKTNKYGVGVQY